jgi:hypothetical protein
VLGVAGFQNLKYLDLTKTLRVLNSVIESTELTELYLAFNFLSTQVAYLTEI